MYNKLNVQYWSKMTPQKIVNDVSGKNDDLENLFKDKISLSSTGITQEKFSL